jgi:hypothetical protein
MVSTPVTCRFSLHNQTPLLQSPSLASISTTISATSTAKHIQMREPTSYIQVESYSIETTSNNQFTTNNRGQHGVEKCLLM